MATKKAAPKEVEEQIEGKPAKEPKEKKESKPRSKFAGDKVITLLVDYNPKRANSAAHASFEHYEDGMTVEEFLKSGGASISLGWDVAHGFIEIGDTFNNKAEKKSKPVPEPKEPKAEKESKVAGEPKKKATK